MAVPCDEQQRAVRRLSDVALLRNNKPLVAERRRRANRGGSTHVHAGFVHARTEVVRLAAVVGEHRDVALVGVPHGTEHHPPAVLAVDGPHDQAFPVGRPEAGPRLQVRAACRDGHVLLDELGLDVEEAVPGEAGVGALELLDAVQLLPPDVAAALYRAAVAKPGSRAAEGRVSRGVWLGQGQRTEGLSVGVVVVLGRGAYWRVTVWRCGSYTVCAPPHPPFGSEAVGLVAADQVSPCEVDLESASAPLKRSRVPLEAWAPRAPGGTKHSEGLPPCANTSVLVSGGAGGGAGGEGGSQTGLLGPVRQQLQLACGPQAALGVPRPVFQW